MNILVTAATENEIAPFRQAGLPADILVTGVGMTAMAYHLGRQLAGKSYGLAVNAGLGGSFSGSLSLGEVVQITSDRFEGLGAEDHENFLDIFQLGLEDRDTFPFRNGVLVNDFAVAGLREASAITVNTVHGQAQSIEKVKTRCPVDTESMEGAAFFYVCMQEKIPCIQLRSISNYVEPRNRKNWNIPLAVKNLNETLIRVVQRYLNT